MTKPQKTVDLDIFTEEILNGKLHFLYSMGVIIQWKHDLNVHEMFTCMACRTP